MNILVFSWRDPKHPLAGGAERSMHEHMKGWAKAGNNVTLFASKINSRPNTEMIDGIKVIRRGYQYLGVQVAGFFYYLTNKSKYDFVVDQFHGIPFFTPLFVKKPKLAVLQEVTREVWFTNPLKFPLNIIVGLIGYIFEPLVFLLYRKTKFMVGSNSAKVDLMKYGIAGSNITIVPHGVVPPPSKVNIVKNKIKTITFFGTALSIDKGIMDAISAFGKLNSLGEYQFWVLGRVETQDYFQKIKSEVVRLGLEKKIKFWGYISDQKKFELLAKSYLLLNPSIREGWCIINIEANLMKTPVIAYPSQGLVDSVKHGQSGILTKESTPEALVKEVVRIAKDNSEYQKLSIGALTWANNFKWSNSRALSLSLIQSISK